MDRPTLRVDTVRLPTPRGRGSEDWVRALLAVRLFVLLASEIGCALYVILDPNFVKDDKSIEHLKDVLTLVLSPTVALFGPATGFYYGTKSDTKAPRGP